jgi:cell wall-associated NlpC family hydrolase
MDEQAQRLAVVDAARAYIGTPYHQNAMLKGVGVDCATLLALAFQDAGVRPPISIGNYSSQWHLHSDEPLYEKAIIENGCRLTDAPVIGDIVLYFQGRQFAHGGIISALEPLSVIHAYAPARCVLEGPEAHFAAIVSVKKKFFSAW